MTITTSLPDYPLNIEEARGLSQTLLSDAKSIPTQTQNVLAALLAHIVNSQAIEVSWSWSELDDALSIATHVENPITDESFFELLHDELGLDVSYSVASAVRIAIRVVALRKVRSLSDQEVFKDLRGVLEA